MEHDILNLKRQIECPQDYDEMKKKIAELNKIVAQQQRWMDTSEDQQKQKIDDTISQWLFLKKLYS